MEPKNPFSVFSKFPFSHFAASTFEKIINCEAMVVSVLPNLRSIRRWVIVLVAIFSISFISWGQADGDYQTLATGNWNANTTWQVRTGGAWVNCLAGDFPGAAAGAGAVNILDGHVVTLTASLANSIGALTFASGNIALSSVVFGGSWTLNVTGAVTYTLPGANNNGDQTLDVGTGTLNCASITMVTTTDNLRIQTLSLSTGSISVTGNVTMATAIQNAITFTGAGTLNIGGNFTTGTGSFTPATGTVNYTGATPQSVGAATYYHLGTFGGGIKTLQGAVNVDGNMSIGTGSTLDASASNFPISLKGFWVSDGTFDERQGKVTFSGTGAQPIVNTISSVETFYDLEFNTTGPVTSNVDLAVTHNLTMTNGTVLLPGKTLTLGISAINPGSLTYAAGWISGTFLRWAVPANNGVDLIFPVGNNSYGRNLILNFSNITVSGVLSANFVVAAPTTGGLPLYENIYVLNQLFPEGYWNLIKDGTFAFTGIFDLKLVPSGFTTFPVDGTTRIVSRLTAGNWFLNGNHVAGSAALLLRSGLNSFTNNYAVAYTETCTSTLINCPSDIVVNNSPGTCANTVSWVPPTMSVPCPGYSITSDHVPGESFTVGIHPVTYKLMNGAVEVGSCTFNVRVNDNENPIINCIGNQARNSDAGVCYYTVIGTEFNPVLASDNCTFTLSNNFNALATLTGAQIPVGLTTVQWTITDASGTSANCSFNITVNDITAPNAVCKDITVFLDAFGNATITGAQVDNGSTDNCGIASMNVVPNTFTTANIGPNPVTLTVTDVNGNISTCNATVTIVGTLPPTAFYSYQTGNWDQASTWTSDPGGTTGPGTTVPGTNDKVVILSGRTVTLPADVTAQNLDFTINNGGILDQSTFKFTNGLASLKGSGSLKLSSSSFPAATLNTFVTTDGGITEYNNSGTMSATQSVYYHLIIRSAGTVVQVNNITLNGNLDVKQGAFQINDATARRLQLIINGDVTVDNIGSITVGTGATNSQVSPLGITGNTGSFLNYYELQSHRIQIYGDFVNNGIVKFSNLSFPVYDKLASNGFATVYFQGLSDKTLNCNGQTDFYNLVVDKGTDQTFKLTVNSSAYNNFRIFGANTSDGSITLPVSPASNPNLKKAIWIKNGTLVLQGLIVIPSLSEGATAGAYPSDYFIPANGALLLDGAGIIVLSTADDFTEVNAAYGLAGGSNVAYGINTSGGYSGLSVLGKLQVNNGYLSTRESSGLLYWSYASGQFILNGGKVDSKQFHNPQGGAVGLVSYVQNGGNFSLRGRFTNNISYVNPADLANATINTARAANGIDATAGIGSFSISSNVDNSFAMAGGTLSIYDVCNTTATPLAFLVNCPVSNINVSGGTVQIIPTTGTALPDANYLINSTAPLNNLIINRVNGASTVQLNTNPLVILNDLTLTSGVFIANNQNVTIGGNFSVAAGTTYTTGTNTTIFNGTGNQTLTVDLAAPLSLNKLTIDKPAGIALNLAGTQLTLNVLSDFRLVLGTINDNSKIVNIAGNVYNSGIHTGAGKITLNGTSTQSIDGNGVFNNLELNNTNVAAAPVSLTANCTINGLLTFSQDKLFDINIYNLKLNSSALIVNGGPQRYIRTAGNSGDGGLTRIYSSTTAFVFPVGAPTLIPVRAVKFTPATIGFTSAPATYGSITVIPVGYEHPATTINGQSLTYFWRVKSSGFTGIVSNVTHTFVYDQTDVAGTEGNYIPSLYDRTVFTWNSGTTTDINTGTNTISDWTSPTNSTNFLDADFTAGDVAFGAPLKFYSIANSAWNVNSTWSYSSGGPAVPAGAVEGINFPGPNSIVVIENNHTVNLTADQRCASLQIQSGSVLDIYTWTGSIFSMVLNSPSGNGLFRLTTTVTPALVPKIFPFPPNSDFSDFNNNHGTTEYYDIDGAAGALYILPANVTSYGNLILTARGGDNIVLPNNALTTIQGDLTCGGDNPLAWIAVSWNTNIVPYNSGIYNPTIEKTVHVTGNLNVNTGTLIFLPEIVPQHLVIDGNVTVGTNGYIDVQPVVYGVPPGAPQPNTISIGGNLINNSNGGSYLRLLNSGYYCDLIFQGSNNTSISGTSPSTIFNKITVNKGNSQATTLALNIGGTLSTLTDNWLTLQNGTFRYIRTNPNTDFTISTTTPFNIPATAGLYIDLPGNTGNRNILIGNAANNTGDLLLSGKLTIINGNVYIGRTTGTDANNNDIEYTSSGASAIDIQGGNLMVNGQIRRNPLNAGGVLKYSQSGGTVAINGQASNATNAKLEVLNGGSDFTMSNGTLTMVRGNGAILTPSSPFGDLYLRPQTSSVTGGTILFSQGALTTQNYFLDANIPLNNLTIAGAVGQPATVRLLVSPLILNGNMTINANSVLDANNINVTFNGNLLNTPGIGGYVYGTNLTTFSAPNGPPFGGAQSITGGITDFYDLMVSPGASLTLSNPTTVNRNLTITSGTLILGANPVSVKGDLKNDAGYTDDNIAGHGINLNGTSPQHISGTGSFARLTLNNAAGAQVDSDITLQEDLSMTLGLLDIKKYLVTLGVNSLIQGAPFSSAKMITSDGVFSNVGLRKFFNTVAATTTFLYPIGTSSKYTPALLTLDASNTVGYVRINNINSRHPSILDPSKTLDYYWEVQSSGITGFTGNLVFNYYQEDVVGDESAYMAARLMVPGTSWNLTPGVDQVNNKITEYYTTSNNLSGEYTAGITTAFYTNVPIFTSNADGNWTNPAIWTQTGGDLTTLTGGPNGFIVIINHEVTLDANFCAAYRMTINNKLKVVSTSFGHNLGTVDGNGTLYLEGGSFPAGVFTTFLSCANNATVEYGGTGTYTIIADLYDNISKIIFSGTGVRVLPNKDLTVCNLLKIDGPTLDNSVYNKKLIIQGTIERYNSGAFRCGTGAGATVSFAGTGPQTVGGVLGDFTGTNTFNNFEINNSAGLSINDPGNIEVSRNLLLTNGLINTGATRRLTITNSAINCVLPSGGSVNSFVNGPLVKNISQYDNFLFPIGIYKVGPGNILGNKLTISSTQTGPLLWSAEYKNPNLTSPNITAPLLGVSAQEYFTIKATAGSQNVININWTPTSDVTPLITGGMSNIRLANYNTGTSKWVEISTSSSGNNFNGTATSTGLVTSTGSDDYTLGSITDLKPRAKLSPTGPVCGAAGIPVTFTAPIPIPFDYTLSYTINGAAQVPITITPAMIPYTLPTPVPGVYKLTDFAYDNGLSIGVVDASSISVFTAPTTSNAGTDQALCGITTSTLAGNTPGVGSGLWSIISGAGGTLIAPANPASQFIGLNGVSYVLRWTISSGTCTSTDDVTISFTILPNPPAASAAQSFCGPKTVADLVATAPVGCTVDWYSATSGGVLLPGATALVSGTTYYAESNGGCVSLTRTPVTVTINPIPAPGLVGPNLVCETSTGNVYNTEPGKSNYIWSVVGGFITSGGLGTDPSATVTWNLPGLQTINVNYQDVGGCSAASPTIYNVTVTPLPAVPTASVTIQPTCAVPTGTIVVTAPLGAAYEYNVDGGAYQAGVTFAGLAPGNHTLTTRLAASPTCISASSGALTVNAVPAVPAVPTASVTIQPTCAVPTGTIVVTAPLGAAYEYNVDGGAYQAGVTFAGLAPGNHTLTTRLAASPTCISASSAALTVNAVPAVPAVPTASVTIQPTCAVPTGTIVVTAPLGAAYEYNIDGGAYQAGVTFAGLAPGNHTLTTRLAASPTCISASSGALTVNAVPAVPAVPTASVTIQPTCAVPTGTIVVTAPLGAAYEYNVDGGAYQAGVTFAGLAPGNHTLTTRLAASPTCISASSGALTVNAVPAVPAVPTASVTIQPTCAVPTGTIVVTAPLGAAYEYNVDGGAYQAGVTFAGLAPGNHTLTTRLAASPTCISASSAALTVNAVPAVPAVPTASVTIQPTCAVPTGTIVVTAPLGAAYEYNVDGGAYQAGVTFAGLAPGNHTLTTRLAASPTCISASSGALTVNAVPAVPAVPTASVTIQPTCAVPTGTIVVTAPLGAAYEYNVDGGAYQAGVTFAGLAPGNHTLTTRLAASPTCISASSGALTVNAVPAVPAVPTASVTIQPTCAVPTGTIVVTAPLGAAYEYNVDGGAYQAGVTFAGLAPGNHTLTTRLAASPTCISASSGALTVNAVPAVPAVPTASVTIQPTCAVPTGTIVVTAPLGAAYEYNVDGGAYQAGVTFAGLAPGNHTLTTRLAASPTCISASSGALTVNAVPAVPAVPTASVTIQPTCAVPTGTIVVTAPLGAAYEYNVDGGAYQAGVTFAGLAPGNHTLTTRLAASPTCISASSGALTVNPVPGAPVVTTTQVNVLCFGGTTGTATAIPAGGLGPYSYSWNTLPVQTTATATGLAAGPYTVTVTDANSCPATANVIITQPAILTGIISSQTNVACFGASTGSVTILAGGGTAPYQYSIDAGTYQVSNIFSGLAAGVHNVSVRDNNSCTIGFTVTITQPASALAGFITAQTNATCFGDSDGSVTIAGAGGTTPYEYNIDGGSYQPSGAFNGLIAGAHTVIVRDANLCTSNVNITITQPAPLTGAITSQTNVLCFGGTTGSISLSGAGGTSPYQYSIDGGPYQVSGTFNGLPAGPHVITVRDIKLCTSIVNISITQPAAALTVTTTQVNVACFGGATGTATATPAGGTGLKTYSWNTVPVQTTATATGLIAGTYTVTVTDANLCTATANVTITQPAAALTVTTTQVNVACFGGATGTATATPAGGTGPFTYSWNTLPVQTTAIATGLIAGTYTVTVTDANLCTAAVNVTIIQPAAALTVTTTQVNVVCFGGATGTATATPAGGTGLKTYSWNTVPVQTSATATGLTAGTYTVTVTDANLCTATANVTITQPAAVLTITTTQVNVACFGGATGTATATPAGGTGVKTYSWNTVPVQTTATATGLIAGTYTVTVTDANLCTATANVTITQPVAALTVTTIQVNVACFGGANGTATATPAGGTGPFTYSWNTLPVQTTATATGLTPGPYIVIVTDANLCTSTANVTITEPPILGGTISSQTNVLCFGGNSGSVTVSGSGGTPGYTYRIGVGAYQPSGTFNTLTAGSYNITVRDANSCTFVVPVTISQPIAALGSSISLQTNVLCFGDATGSITVAGSGGTSPYEYNIDGGLFQASGIFNALLAGVHNIIVRDANMCTFNMPVNITQPLSALSGSIVSQTNVLCFGGSTGSVTVAGSGGTPPYQYSLDAGSYLPLGTFNGLSTGVHSVTIRDANNCIYNILVNITQPGAALTVTTTKVDVICFGGSTGTATATPAGGTGPFTYSWNTLPVQTTSTATGLIAGNYTVTVTDANLCTATANVTITQPAAALTVTTTQVNVACFGGATGTATATPAGGTGLKTYSWNTVPVQTTATATGLTAGTYTVTVTDANLCTATANVTITQPAAALTVTTTQVNVACSGGTTGTATATPAGGTGLKTYSWNTVPVQTTATATGLIAGTYIVTVTDANLCIATANVTITQPAAALTVTTTQVNVACFGEATGTATATPAGGTVPFTYSWNTLPVQTTAIATGLIAGTYTVTVTDANLCTATANVTVTQPAATLTVTTTQVNVACFGGATGTATATPAGGTGLKTYSWNTVPVQTTVIATGLIAGTYTVTVTDANLCTATANVTITQPAAVLTVTTTQVNVACFGGATGTATATPAGGTGPFTYSWNTLPVQTTATATGLTPGPYIVTVTDANLCTSTANVTITEPVAALSGSITSQTNVSSYGGNDGSVTVAGSAGTGPYQYKMGAGVYQLSGTFNTLTAGSYTITVQDANLCTFNIPVTITQPLTVLTGSITSQTNVTCFGASTGSATVSGSGGASPYEYKLGAGIYQVSGTFNSLTAGIYTVTIRDALLSTFDVTVTITQPVVLSATTAQVNVKCFGGATGTATATPAGGTGPFIYSWNTLPVQTTATATGMIAGPYTVIVTDANLCTAIANVTITQPAAPLTVTTTQINVNCFGGATGTATATPAGGTGPYTYSWNTLPVQTTATATGLIAGPYTVSVTDANLCSATAIVTITQPAAVLTVITTHVNVKCFGGVTGTATATPAGGTSPYTYSWNTLPVQTTATATGLAAAAYTVTVTDANSCTATANVTITQPAAALSGSTAVTNVLCFGGNTGAVNLTIAGGIAPFTYAWTGPGGYTAASEDLSGLIAGVFNATITDAGGCTTTTAVFITQPSAALNGTTVVTNVLCSGGNTGAINLTVSGGTAPYTFLWNNSASTEDISGLIAGSYTVKVTDANGCFINIAAQVTQPSVLSIEAAVVNASCPDVRDGLITLTITGGTSPYTIIWSDGRTLATRSATDSTYSVVVTDANLCAASLVVEVSFDQGSACLEVPKVLTPNGDGKNDTWIMRNIDMYPDAEVLVFNRWGKLIYHTKNISANPWDGKYQGKLVPVDSYTYILYLNDGSKPRSGVISVIR